MSTVESQLQEYLKSRLDSGALAVAAEDIHDAVVPRVHPEFREKPEYRYSLDHFRRRRVINAVDDKEGRRYYHIGKFPSPDLHQMLGLAL